MNDLSRNLLFFGALWDFVCAVAMMLTIITNRMNVLTWTRVSLWIDVEPQDASAMMLMYALWISNFSLMGFMALATDDIVLAGWCYILDAFMLFIAVTRGWVEPARGWTTLTFGVVYLMILMM